MPGYGPILYLNRAAEDHDVIAAVCPFLGLRSSALDGRYWTLVEQNTAGAQVNTSLDKSRVKFWSLSRRMKKEMVICASAHADERVVVYAQAIPCSFTVKQDRVDGLYHYWVATVKNPVG